MHIIFMYSTLLEQQATLQQTPLPQGTLIDNIFFNSLEHYTISGNLVYAWITFRILLF